MADLVKIGLILSLRDPKLATPHGIVSTFHKHLQTVRRRSPVLG